MQILIISVGKKNLPELDLAINKYQNRLQGKNKISWLYIKPSSLSESQARLFESNEIIQKLKPNDTIWLLDERGQQVDSPSLSARLSILKVNAAARLVIVIGGAYGVDDSIRAKANWVWSLSKLVFPHQLVRLILLEQLYRAQEIERGSGYHHA